MVALRTVWVGTNAPHDRHAAAGGDTTLDEHSHTGVSAGVQPEGLALVIAHAEGEPWRVGTVAFVPVGTARCVLGRGPTLGGDPGPRLAFGQQRPSGNEGQAALSSATISRVQLVIRAEPERLEVENVGRARLLHNGVEGQRVDVVPGDTLQLGRGLLLLCVRRPERLPQPAEAYRVHAFGEPDAHGIVGESPAIWKLRQQLAYIAVRPGHVLLLGPSGSGKELAARAVHGLSAAGARKLVARNAATIPEGIADAELFGNARNYPNPGMPQRKGLVGEADDSTLFLDEFAELSPGVQARMLRVLDDGEYQPLGDAHARRSSFRLVAATNRPESALKPDLVARFRFRIELPDLNARREDIPLLVRHLLQGSAPVDEHPDARISCALLAECLRRPYRANVRELAAWLAEVASASAGHAPILARASAAPASSHAASSEAPARAPGVRDDASTSELKAAEIQAMLDKHNGQIEATWRALGLNNRHALARLIAKHGIEIRKRPGSSR
jgi:two-component system nitrogen regulation response regulator GlnG/two-component system response regulator HydG